MFLTNPSAFLSVNKKFTFLKNPGTKKGFEKSCLSYVMELICLFFFFFCHRREVKPKLSWCPRVGSRAQLEAAESLDSLSSRGAPHPPRRPPAGAPPAAAAAAAGLKQQARSTGALPTGLLGLGLQLSGASAPLALGAQNHLEGLPGFWAFLGGHRVPPSRAALCRTQGLGREDREASGEEKGCGAGNWSNFPPNKPTSRLTGSRLPTTFQFRPRPSRPLPGRWGRARGETGSG